MTKAIDDDRERLRSRVDARQADTLGHVLSRATRLFNAQALAAVHAAGFHEVRESWIGLLRHLEPDGVRSSVLAARLHTSRQAAGQLVNDLERLEYLERVPDPSDGRAKLVRLTAKGWSAWLTGLEALNDLERSLAVEVGSEPLAALHRSGRILLDALERRSQPREN